MPGHSLMTRLFHGVSNKSTPQEDLLFDCATALYKLEAELGKKMPLPEGKSVLLDVHKTTEVWSFELLLWDRLAAKGWPTYPGKGQNTELTRLLKSVSSDASCDDGRLNFDIDLKFAKKGHRLGEGGGNAGLKYALNFLLAHVGELEQVVKELQAFKPEDLGPRHKCLLVSKDDDNRPALYDQLKNDFGVFAYRRVPAHLKVIPVTEPPAPPAQPAAATPPPKAGAAPL